MTGDGGRLAAFHVRFVAPCKVFSRPTTGRERIGNMGTETMTDAQRVAVDHADTLQRFGEWLEMFGDGATRRDVERFVDDDDADDDVIAAVNACRAWFVDTGADDLSWSAFMADVLDIEIGGRFGSHSGEWHVTDVAALISCGGPNVRYHVLDGGTIRVSVAWWNDYADRVIDCSLAGYLDQWADDVAGSR